MMTLGEHTYTLTELMPHDAPMLLLSDLIHFNDEECVASVHITPESLFFDDDGVPAYVGIEYMAQTIALWAGIQSRLAGQSPKIGFLLGTRKYETHVTHFKKNMLLSIRVTLSFRQDNLGVFACTLSHDGQLLATASVNVYQPESMENIL